MSVVFGESLPGDKQKGELASQAFLLDFIATVAFALTSSQQFDSIVSRTLALFDRPEYEYVPGLLFAHAHTSRAVMGFLSRLVGFGKKSPTLVKALFTHGASAVSHTFNRIRSLDSQDAKPLVVQFDSIISQLRIVVSAAAVEGPEAMRSSGILPAIRERGPQLRDCLNACFSGEQFSVPVTASLLSLFSSIIESLSPITKETAFMEEIFTTEHLSVIAGSLIVTSFCVNVPVSIDKLSQFVKTLWHWRVTQIFFDRQGNHVVPKEELPPPGGAPQTVKRASSNPFKKAVMKVKKEVAEGSPAPARAGGKDTTYQASLDALAARSDVGALRWGPISQFILSLVDIAKVLCTAKSQAWTAHAAKLEVVSMLAALMRQITNDVLVNAVVTALYRILENSLPEILSDKGLSALIQNVLATLSPKNSTEGSRFLAPRQARTIRFLALIKYQIKNPSKLVKELLKAVVSAAPAAEEILLSWHEVGTIQGIAPSQLKNSDAIDGLPAAPPKSPAPSTASSGAARKPKSKEEELIVAEISAIIETKLQEANLAQGAAKEELLREYYKMKGQLDAMVGGASPVTQAAAALPPANVVTPAPVHSISLSQTSLPLMPIGEFEHRKQMLFQVERDVQRKAAELAQIQEMMSPEERKLKEAAIAQEVASLENWRQRAAEERLILQDQEARRSQQSRLLQNSRLETDAAATNDPAKLREEIERLQQLVKLQEQQQSQRSAASFGSFSSFSDSPRGAPSVSATPPNEALSLSGGLETLWLHPK